jgi:hypothetical protein
MRILEKYNLNKSKIQNLKDLLSILQIETLLKANSISNKIFKKKETYLIILRKAAPQETKIIYLQK